MKADFGVILGRKARDRLTVCVLIGHRPVLPTRATPHRHHVMRERLENRMTTKRFTTRFDEVPEIGFGF